MTLQAGDKAPAFTAKDQDGNPISLSDFKGKKVVLYFYPKDDTPSCTKEACSFRDNHSKLKRKGYVVIGVSADSEKAHRKFIAKYGLPFTLISDEEHQLLEAYGVWGLKKFMGREFMGIIRTTFVIDEKGKIERIIDKVNTQEAAEQILTGK
jgi:thioredoxin-dependent peroxiredoxin